MTSPFDNIVISPVCLISKDEDRVLHLKELEKYSFTSVKEYKKGSVVFEEMNKSFPTSELKGVLIAIGHIKPYES